MKFYNIIKSDGIKKKPVMTSLRTLDKITAEVPKVVEERNLDYVKYGEDNLYPVQLWDLKFGSAIHNSILKTKTKMMYGDGFLINGNPYEDVLKSLQGATKFEAEFLFKNEHGNCTLEELVELLCTDYQDFGAYCYEIIFNKDFTKIAGLKHVKAERVRCGKEVNGKIETYYYAKDWDNIRGLNKPRPIAAYNPEDKTNFNQLVYRKSGNMDYYGIPSYAGSINWIHTDVQMAVFHRSNIENGMNPGLHFKFFQKPASEEDEIQIIKNIKRQWRGALNTGKELVTFSDGKELSMEIAPIEVSNLDKQMIVLAELCDKKILSGHQLTSPLLAGISVSGQIGGNTELSTAFQIFDGLSMAADRKVIERDLNWWFDFNKTGLEVDIKKFNPFVNE